ncbi:hypothetical protein LXL04_027532 [Taraxacum kok-saghyz]
MRNQLLNAEALGFISKILTNAKIIEEEVNEQRGYFVSFEDLCEKILQAMLKLDEKIKETNEKFPINLEISEWLPRFDGLFWDFIVDG